MTKEVKAPKKTAAGDSQRSRADEETYQRNLFMTMLLSMTWQLAAAVLVPFVGGYYLDQYFGLSPVLTITGAAIAVLSVVGVMIRIVTEANRRASSGNRKEDTK